MSQNKEPQSEPAERIYTATEWSFGYILVMLITALLLLVLVGMLLASPVMGIALAVIGVALAALITLAL